MNAKIKSQQEERLREEEREEREREERAQEREQENHLLLLRQSTPTTAQGMAQIDIARNIKLIPNF